MILSQKRYSQIPEVFLNENMSYILSILDIEDIYKLSQIMKQGENILRWERYIMPLDLFNQLSTTSIRKYTIQDGKIKLFDQSYNILKNDGNVYEHSVGQANLIYTYGKYDLEGGHLDVRSYEKLIVLGFIHDIGEILGGDITYDHKNEFTEAEERENGEGIIKSIFDNNKKIEWLIDTYSINFEKNHNLAFIFKIYEKFSYLKGSFWAYDWREELYDPIHLIHNVLKNQISSLNKFIKIIPSIKYFIKDHYEQIDMLFALIDNVGFETDIPADNEAYQQAKVIWETEMKPFIS